jgi:raffinose/stachyose/melibiose transport system permease protein
MRPLSTAKTLQWFNRNLIYFLLSAYALIPLFPIALIVMNSLKTRKAIFGAPFQLPFGEVFSLEGYQTVMERTDFPLFFTNSMIVTLVAMFLVLLFGAMAAFALSEYEFPGNPIMTVYLLAGIMIPIRLGTVGIVRLMVSIGLINTLTALIMVYVAQGLPMTIFILQQFMRQVPLELKDAARVDGASEYRIFWLILPLVRPAVATVAVFTIIPIWNDLWFPLVLAPGEKVKTLTLGAQIFIGQYVINWNAVLASLTLSMLPVLILYALFSRQLIRGLTAGAIK